MIILEEIWFINDYGICLFNYSIDKKMDPELFSPIFTAINQFGQKAVKNSINEISMGKNYLLSLDIPDYKLKLVGRTSQTKNREIMEKMLIEIAEKFKNHFTVEEIAQYKGQVDQFAPFSQFITAYFDQQEQLIQNFKSIL